MGTAGPWATFKKLSQGAPMPYDRSFTRGLLDGESGGVFTKCITIEQRELDTNAGKHLS